jgi:hypothetical protein
MKTVKDITYSLNDIEKKGYGIENNIIKEIDINIIAHFGNIPCLTIMCENIMPYGHYNDIARLGFLLKAIVEFFEVYREDGVMLSKLKNIPCRLVFEENGKNHWGEKVVGIGHYMKDKFILFEDFNELADHPTEKGGE